VELTTGKSLTQDNVSTLLFAEDQILLSNSKSELQHSLYSLNMII